jgi:hypothetical protein
MTVLCFQSWGAADCGDCRQAARAIEKQVSAERQIGGQIVYAG